MFLTKISLDFFLPHICILCKSSACQNIDLCDQCFKLLPWIHNSCSICAKPLLMQLKTNICIECIDHSPLYYKAIVLFRYQNPIKKLIRQFKFDQQFDYGYLFAHLLIKKVTLIHPILKNAKNTIIIPIPLHKKRLKQRGYNQSLELAKFLAKALNLPFKKKWLIRKKNTPAQSELPANMRIKNMQNAFFCPIALEGKQVILIDDVMTTGATVHEASKTLLLAGASRIYVICLSRT